MFTRLDVRRRALGFACHGPPVRRCGARRSAATARCAAASADERWMRVALHEARAAGLRGEVPIGAVLVSAAGNAIGRKGNAVELLTDPTMHAEMRAIREAAAAEKSWRLLGTTLYSTLEPCPMCLSAAAMARVSRVVYGAPDLRIGACGTWIDLANKKHPFHNFDEVVGGVLSEESAELMRNFFRERRREKELMSKPSVELPTDRG